MRELFRNRRGSVAFATVVALVPVIGFLALGAEGGSWYVIKQHAQSAADAAAYSGALKLACEMGPSGCTTDVQSVDYRGKQFAAQNSFCQGGDVTAYPGSRCTSPPSGVSRTVTIAQLTTWKGATGSFVQATITQQQPAYLTKLLGFSTVTMAATAVAQVVVSANPCVLSLQDPIAFQGSTTVQAQNCGLGSNSTASNSIDFTGNGLDVSNAGAITGRGGCAQTGGSPCATAITYAPPTPNPLSGLDAPMATLSASSFAAGKCPNTTQPTAYTAGAQCYNDNFTFKNSTTYPLNGVYFFGGNLKIQGGTITGTVTFVLLPTATLTFSGSPLLTITAPSTVSAAQVPAALTSVLSLMSNLLIYDPETTSGNNKVNIGANGTNSFSGITYAPNASVLYTGSTVSSTCTEVIAKGVSLSGNSNFDNSGCSATSRIESKIVKLVP